MALKPIDIDQLIRLGDDLIKSINDFTKVQQAKDNYNNFIKMKHIKECKFPKTWAEFCDDFDIKPVEVSIGTNSLLQCCANRNPKRSATFDSNILPNNKYAIAILALCKLIQLRDCYRQNWEPDWEDDTVKHCIDLKKLEIVSFKHSYYIFSFQSEEICHMFLTNFKDLLNDVKYLI